MAERNVIKIAVSSPAKKAVEDLCVRYGMTQQEVASRMYQWLADQGEIVQTSVLGLLPADVEHEAADIYMEQVKARRAEHRTPRGKGKREPK